MTEDRATRVRCALPIIAALVVGFVCRFGWAHHVRNQPLFGDGILFEYFARAILHGQYPAEALNSRSLLAPGYPAFVALVYSVTGSGNDYAVRVVQCFLSVASIWVLARMATKLFNARVGIGKIGRASGRERG